MNKVNHEFPYVQLSQEIIIFVAEDIGRMLLLIQRLRHRLSSKQRSKLIKNILQKRSEEKWSHQSIREINGMC